MQNSVAANNSPPMPHHPDSRIAYGIDRRPAPGVYQCHHGPNMHHVTGTRVQACTGLPNRMALQLTDRRQALPTDAHEDVDQVEGGLRDAGACMRRLVNNGRRVQQQLQPMSARLCPVQPAGDNTKMVEWVVMRARTAKGSSSRDNMLSAVQGINAAPNERSRYVFMVHATGVPAAPRNDKHSGLLDNAATLRSERGCLSLLEASNPPN